MYARESAWGCASSVLHQIPIGWFEARLRSGLERKPRAQLYLASRSRSLCNRSKLGRIHEAVRRAQVRVVECIEELPAELDFGPLGDGEVAS